MHAAFLRRVGLGWALVFVLGLGPQAARAQSLDVRAFDAVYGIDAPAFGYTMRAADRAAYPGMLGATATLWSVAALSGDPWDDAYFLTVSQAGALVATLALKVTVRRTRPYVRFPHVTTRTIDIARRDPFSFPSGHAALAFATATSLSLSYPRWYVVAPGYAWALLVAVSRVWLGVHYPADMLAGALLGTAAAWGTHRLGQRLVPRFLEREAAAPPLMAFRIRF